jgi:hypothetical protein
MASDVEYGSLPFKEAINFFRQKVNLPTKKWNDLWQGMHARAFTVAGATKAELLCDLRAAIDKAISQGTTLETFRKDFDAIVAKHGWSYKGGRNWRTDVMLNTNIRTAYMAGRYQQMMDPDTKAERPNWEYRHGDSIKPRPEHIAWDGKVIPADDPWWSTHYPPNGWGCKCKVFALSDDDLKDLGKTAPDEAPDDGTTTKVDKKTGEEITVPVGIDPGWAYNVGEAAWGRTLSDEAWKTWQAQKGQAWERLTPGNWESYGRPKELPLDRTKVDLFDDSPNVLELSKSIRKVLGGEEKVFPVGDGDWRLPVLVNAETLAHHLEMGRAPFISLLPELLQDPFEVWLAFERHKGTGKVALKTRIIKGVQIRDKRLLLVAQSNEKGMMEAWTFMPLPNEKYLNNQRQGRLIYARK